MLERANGAGWWELYQPLGRRGSGFIPLKILNASVNPALASLQQYCSPVNASGRFIPIFHDFSKP